MNHGVNHSFIVSTAAIVVTCMAFAVHAADPGTPGQGASASHSTAVTEPVQSTGVTGGAMRVYIDPETGKPSAPPAGFVPEEGGARATLSLPAAVPNPGPAGGFMLNTKGLRFGFEATTTADGKTTVECRPQGAKAAGEGVQP